MIKKAIGICIMIIGLCFFLTGCAKTEVKTAPSTGPADTQPEETQPLEATGDEYVDGVSTEITEADSLDEELDSGDLDNLESDLGLVDW
jgi:PBP1b-binding outer membrane lipoprotein LpoB